MNTSKMFINPIRRHAFFMIITTFFLMRYQYGINNQVQVLPHIYHLIENNIGADDFYTESLSDMKHRLFVIHILAFFASYISTPLLFLLLTLVINYIIVSVTFHAAKKVGGCNDLGAAFCVVLLACNPTSDFAGRNTIALPYFTPLDAAHVLSISALFYAFKVKNIKSTLLFVLATIFHPIVGIIFGFIAIAVGVSFRLQHYHLGSESNFKKILEITIPITIFITTSLFWLFIGYEEKAISDDRFIEIMCIFRHPHHYLASTFSIGTIIRHLLFLIILGYLIYDKIIKEVKCNPQQKTDFNTNTGVVLAAIYLFINISMIGTYILIEIMKSRFGAKIGRAHV